MYRTIGISVLLTVSGFATASAEKNSAIKARIAATAMPVVTQAFDAALAEPLTAVKGHWAVVDGVLIGKELPSDQHAAVLNYQKKNRNSVVRFSFRLDGNTTGFNFSLNHAKGHLFRVVIAPSSMTISLDKDKKDPQSKAVVLGAAKGRFEQGKWYTLQVEMKADHVVAQTDNGLLVEASHPTLDIDKPNYRFVMKGDSLSIDDLHIQELW